MWGCAAALAMTKRRAGALSNRQELGPSRWRRRPPRPARTWHRAQGRRADPTWADAPSLSLSGGEGGWHEPLMRGGRPPSTARAPAPAPCPASSAGIAGAWVWGGDGDHSGGGAAVAAAPPWLCPSGLLNTKPCAYRPPR